MTTEQQDTKPTGLALLRAPFPANQISKLPKESRAQADERKSNRNSAINCAVCGGWHHRNAVHLDYVGHAALTDRLLDVDPHWNWEPMGVDDRGLPALDKNGGLWIKLTVCGVTRVGYGDAEGKTGGAATKELIGDALRNAAMRFGAALDLWHKGVLHADEGDGDTPPASRPKPPAQHGEPRQDIATQAAQIIKRVKELKDAAGAADFLGGLNDDAYMKLWDKLPLDVQDAISAMWATTKEAA